LTRETRRPLWGRERTDSRAQILTEECAVNTINIAFNEDTEQVCNPAPNEEDDRGRGPKDGLLKLGAHDTLESEKP